MVLIFAELERKWQWEWILRPHQKVGMTVADYYTRFFDWRHEMVTLSFPAEEGDYIDGFIANLRSDVVGKLSTEESCWSRLIDAYYAARFAELMTIIEHNMRQIKTHKLFAEMSHSENGENDEIQGAEVVGEANSNEILVQVEEDCGKDVSSNVDVEVLNELPQPAFIEIAGYKVLESGEGTDSLQNSLAERAFKFYKSPKPTLTGLHSFSKELVETVEGSFLTNQKDFKVPCKAFDEMPWLFSIMSYGEINGDRNSIAPLDRVPRVFDPGTFESLQNVGVLMMSRISSTNNASIILFNLGCCFGSQLSMLDCDLIDSIGVKQYWDKMPSTSFAECCVGKAFTLILDPSGLNALHCARDELCRTDLCSRHKNNQEYSAFGECKNVLYFNGYDALFLFDPGEGYSLLRAWNWTCDFEDRNEQQGQNMMRENAKYVLFSFDPGGVSWPSSGYRVSNLKCFASASKLVPYSFNNASSLFISYGFIAFVIFPSTCDANGDRSIALNNTWDNNRNKLALLHNFLHTQPANLFAVALVKIKTGILLFVFDPGGSLPLQSDFDALKCLVGDVANFSINSDYTINMVEIISKEIDDKYSQVQLVFTMALKSPDIGFSKVEIDDRGNIITDINCMFVTPLIKLRLVLIFELHRHEDEVGGGQLPLVVLSPSITIAMCVVLVVLKIVVVSNDFAIIQAGAISLLVIIGVITSGHFFMVADTIELLAGEAYNMVNVGNKLSKLSSLCMKSFVGKTFNQSTLYKSWQQVQDSIQPAQSLIEKLQQLTGSVIKCSYVGFPDSFSVTWDPIMIGIVDFSGKNWVTKFLSVGNDSSTEMVHEDFGSKIMSIGLDMSSRKDFNWVNQLREVRCFLRYLNSIGIMVAQLQIFVWDPGQNIISIYILEDKDVVARVGKDMVLMDTLLVIRRYDHEVQLRCLDMMFGYDVWILQVEQCAQGLDTVSLLNEKDRDMGLIYNVQRASTLLHTLNLSCKLGGSAFIIHFGVVMNDPSFIIVVESFVWDPGLILVYFRFSTLRTRWLLRGRICHDMTF